MGNGPAIVVGLEPELLIEEILKKYIYSMFENNSDNNSKLITTQNKHKEMTQMRGDNTHCHTQAGCCLFLFVSYIGGAGCSLHVCSVGQLSYSLSTSRLQQS